jgi:hypothetical protein
LSANLVALECVVALRQMSFERHVFDPQWCQIPNIAALGATEAQIESMWRVTRRDDRLTSDLETAMDTQSVIRIECSGAVSVMVLGRRYALRSPSGNAAVRTPITLEGLCLSLGRTPLCRSAISFACPVGRHGPICVRPTLLEVALIRAHAMNDLSVDESYQAFSMWSAVGVNRDQFEAARNLVVHAAGYCDYEALRGYSGVISVGGDGTVIAGIAADVYHLSPHGWATSQMPGVLTSNLYDLVEQVKDRDEQQTDGPRHAREVIGQHSATLRELMPNGQWREVKIVGPHAIAVPTLTIGLTRFAEPGQLLSWLEQPQAALDDQVPEYLLQTMTGDQQVRTLLADGPQ